jgi:hypothetical protein
MGDENNEFYHDKLERVWDEPYEPEPPEPDEDRYLDSHWEDQYDLGE